MGERKAPVKSALLELHGDYEGWHFKARTNPKLKSFSLIASGNVDKIREGLAQIVLEWDFVDEDGAPLGSPSGETMGEVGFDLAMAMSNRFIEELQKLPPA